MEPTNASPSQHFVGTPAAQTAAGYPNEREDFCSTRIFRSGVPVSLRRRLIKISRCLIAIDPGLSAITAVVGVSSTGYYMIYAICNHNEATKSRALEDSADRRAKASR